MERYDILVVDDDEFNIKLAKRILEKNFSVATAMSGEEALMLLNEHVPGLILLDLHMPEMDGRETMKRIQENETWKNIPIIFLTADNNPETEKECLVLGAADFIVKPFVPMVMLSRVSRTLELYTLRNDLEKRLEEKTRLVEKVSLNSIMAIANTIDAKDAYTSGHSIRVAKCAEAIAARLGWDEDGIQNIHYIALLHDIGKIGVPDAILNKPSRLSNEEFEIIKKHPIIGNEILKDVHMIRNVAEGALYHHERYDGSGYPFKLAGEEIPICARIIGIADAYDAMTSNRIYRAKLSRETVIEEFEMNKGKQFDPQLAEVFITMLKEGFCISDESNTVEGEAWENEDGVAGASSVLLQRVLTEYTSVAQNRASTDELTGLYNRNYAQDQITQMLHEGNVGALFMIDMDNFKYINDTYGHIAGDNVLKMFADALRANADEQDIICRLGGDEFIAFFKGTVHREVLSKKAENILKLLAAKLAEIECDRITSVSIGIALCPGDGKNFETLYNNADKTLYYVKKNGKNSYAFYSDEKSENVTAGNGIDLDHIRYMIEGRMDKDKGVFKVEYGEFKQLYNYISRGVKRNGQKVQTLLFTISVGEQNNAGNGILETAMHTLEVAVTSSLRMVDVGTRYSSMQYIVILLDTDLENGKMVADRVVKQFYKIHGGNELSLSYDIQTMLSGMADTEG